MSLQVTHLPVSRLVASQLFPFRLSPSILRNQIFNEGAVRSNTPWGKINWSYIAKSIDSWGFASNRLPLIYLTCTIPAKTVLYNRPKSVVRPKWAVQFRGFCARRKSTSKSSTSWLWVEVQGRSWPGLYWCGLNRDKVDVAEFQIVFCSWLSCGLA